MYTGWCITHDYADADRVGYGMSRSDADETTASFNRVIGRTVYVTPGLEARDVRDPRKFRLLDDDGEWCFEGVISLEWLEEEELCFMPLTFAETDVGATTMHIYEAKKGWTQL